MDADINHLLQFMQFPRMVEGLLKTVVALDQRLLCEVRVLSYGILGASKYAFN